MNDLAARLRDIADSVGALTVDRHDPHAFFERRDQLRADLRRLGDEVIQAARHGQAARFETGRMVVNGREIRVERRKPRGP